MCDPSVRRPTCIVLDGELYEAYSLFWFCLYFAPRSRIVETYQYTKRFQNCWDILGLN